MSQIKPTTMHVDARTTAESGQGMDHARDRARVLNSALSATETVTERLGWSSYTLQPQQNICETEMGMLLPQG